MAVPTHNIPSETYDTTAGAQPDNNRTSLARIREMEHSVSILVLTVWATLGAVNWGIALPVQ